MKLQDILFLTILIPLLIWIRKPKLFFGMGLIFFALSIPLYVQWIFFTAQRFTMYAAAFIAIGAVLELVTTRSNK